MSVRGWVACERAHEADVPALVELDRKVSAHARTEASFRAVLTSEHQDLLVLRAYRRHADRTLRQVLAYCAFQLLVPELEIHALAVQAEHQRQGWGGRLLRLVLDKASRRGATLAWLEVRVSNGRARKLYASAGFVEVQRRSQYYREPPEDALVLRSDLYAGSARKEP